MDSHYNPFSYFQSDEAYKTNTVNEGVDSPAIFKMKVREPTMMLPPIQTDLAPPESAWREPTLSSSPFASPVESPQTKPDWTNPLAEILPFGGDFSYQELLPTNADYSMLNGLALDNNTTYTSEVGSGFRDDYSSSALAESEDPGLVIFEAIHGRRSQSFGDNVVHCGMPRDAVPSTSASSELQTNKEFFRISQGARLSRTTSLRQPKNAGMSPQEGFSDANSRTGSHTDLYTDHPQITSSSLANAPIPIASSSNYLDQWAQFLPCPKTSWEQELLPPSPPRTFQLTFQHSQERPSTHGTKKRVASDAILRASKLRRRSSKRFGCPRLDCTSTFTTKVKQQGHINAHDNVKPFECMAGPWGCLRAFARACDLKRHRKTCKLNPAREPKDTSKIK